MRAVVACPRCGDRLLKLYSCSCGWETVRPEREYLKSNWVRFPLAALSLILGLFTLWVLGGILALMALTVLSFFVTLGYCTLKTAGYLADPPYDPELCKLESRHNTKAFECYGQLGDELVEQYQERYALLKRRKGRRRREARQLVTVARARLELVKNDMVLKRGSE